MSDPKFDSTAIIPGPVGSQNRGMDNAITSNDPPQLTVTLEKINSILMDYLANTIRPDVVENDVQRPVPVSYASAERWATMRKEGVVRDEQGKILCPNIMLHRTNVRKGQLVNPVNKYMYRTITQEWNSRTAYDRFAVQNNIRPSMQVRHIMVPDYVDLEYEVVMWTDYIVQMDRLIEQINAENEEWWGNRNDFKFRVNIDEFPSENTIEAEQDRVTRTTFSMTVSAFILPERVVKNFRMASTDSKLYTAKKVVAITEAVKNINNLNEK